MCSTSPGFVAKRWKYHKIWIPPLLLFKWRHLCLICIRPSFNSPFYKYLQPYWTLPHLIHWVLTCGRLEDDVSVSWDFFFLNFLAHYINPSSVSRSQVGVCTCVLLLAALIGNEWPPLSFCIGLSAMTPAQNPPLSMHGPRTGSFWRLWHIRLCNKLNFLRSGCWLLLCSVKPTDTVESMLSPNTQADRTVGGSANKLQRQLSAVFYGWHSFSFSFHFTESLCLKDCGTHSPALDHAFLHSSASFSLAPLHSDRSPVCFSSHPPLLERVSWPLFRMRWQPR